jgi:hypothetical protein
MCICIAQGALLGMQLSVGRLIRDPYERDNPLAVLQTPRAAMDGVLHRRLGRIVGMVMGGLLEQQP